MQPTYLKSGALHVSGALLLSACLFAYLVIVLRSRHLTGMSRLSERVGGLVIVSAVIGAHVTGVLVDRGISAISSEPGLLLRLDSPLSSAGGIGSGTIAFLISCRALGIDRRTILMLSDLVAYAFPFAWLLARSGCALAHDHPGRLSSSILAMRFSDGQRLDCGLLELFATPVLILLVVVLTSSKTGGATSLHSPRMEHASPPQESKVGKVTGEHSTPPSSVISPSAPHPTRTAFPKHPPPGQLTGSMAVAYSLVRFPLDFLRATDLPRSDPRHLGLTAAQWVMLAVFVAGAALLVQVGRARNFQGRRGARHARVQE